MSCDKLLVLPKIDGNIWKKVSNLVLKNGKQIYHVRKECVPKYRVALKMKAVNFVFDDLNGCTLNARHYHHACADTDSD